MTVLLAWPWLLSAAVVQRPSPRLLGAGDGLPTPAIRAIGEDATGYLWLASSDGLLRFDGQRYRVLRQEDGLPDVDLQALHIDALDRVWLGTATQGVVMLGVDRSTFERADATAPAAVRQGRIRQVTSGRDGTLWVIGDDGQLYGHVPGHPGWTPQALGAATVTLLIRDPRGAVWAGAGHRLWRRSGVIFEPFPLPPAIAGPVLSLWVDPAGGVEITTAQGSWLLDRSGRLRSGPHPARSLLRDSRGVRWQQQADGALSWQWRGATHPMTLGEATAGTTPRMRQLLEDRHGDVWWVGEHPGLWWLPAKWQRFTALPATADGATGLTVHHARGLARSGSHHLWVAGGRGDLQRLDVRSGRAALGLPLPLQPGAQMPVGMAEDARGRLWLADSAQLVRYDPAARQHRQWSQGGAWRPSAASLQICQQQVWLVHADALQQWSLQGERLRSVRPEHVGLGADVPARQLLCTGDGGLWATDPGGLARWDPMRERFERPPGDLGGAVSALAVADDGTLWAARAGALDRYRVRGRTVQHVARLSSAQGYPPLRADALAVQANGVVWAGAARGLVRIDPRDHQVALQGVAQGLPVQEILPHRLLRLGSGVLAAGVREGGLLLFDPAAVPAAEPVPVLVVDAMTRRRHARMREVATSAVPASLSTADRNIRVAVRLLGRGDPERIQHRFRLLGLDPAWVDTGPVAQRIFARLPAGEHVLLMQARHAGGPWSAVRELPLRVVPPWWRMPATQAALAVTGGGVVLVAARLLQRQRRRRERDRQHQAGRELAELDSLQRTRFLARLGRQIRMPLTPVLGWTELLQRQMTLSPTQRAQVGSLHQAGHHLLQLMDDALDVASIEVDRLQPRRTPFAPVPLLQELQDLMEPLATSKALTLRWSSALAPDSHYLGDPQRLRQILLNLLGNALKFTVRGDVRVTAGASTAASGLWFEVEDTGPGMTTAQLRGLFQRYRQADGASTVAQHGGSGLGLAISRELARIMGGDIGVESVPGRGTRFRVALPWPCTSIRPLPAARSAPPVPAVLATLQVMVLVSSASVTDVVCALLRSQGHRVVGVDDVEAWLSVIDSGPWDLIVADPDMLVENERLSARLPWLWPGVPRLALSARADPGAEREALAAGFDQFLHLPLTGTRLAVALSRCRSPR